MKFFLFIFLFIISCTSLTNNDTKRIYICGDHPCKNKKEIKNYFENNISVEVYTVSTKKRKDDDINLVQLNLSDEENKEYVSLNEREKDIKKEVSKRKKMVKINKKEEIKTNQTKKKTLRTKPGIFGEKGKNKIISNKTNLTLVRLCKNVEECDIDKVSKIILDMGREKGFPDITATQ